MYGGSTELMAAATNKTEQIVASISLSASRKLGTVGMGKKVQCAYGCQSVRFSRSRTFVFGRIHHHIRSDRINLRQRAENLGVEVLVGI